jgi:uncharacterized repeat protein (TIGR02543 family)
MGDLAIEEISALEKEKENRCRIREQESPGKAGSIEKAVVRREQEKYNESILECNPFPCSERVQCGDPETENKMMNRKLKKCISVILLVILLLSICFSELPAASADDGERPGSAVREAGESDLLLKTEEDFLTEGVFDTEKAYAYYLTLTEEEQNAFLESLSEENAQLLKERIDRTDETPVHEQTRPSETDPDASSGTLPGEGEKQESREDPDSAENKENDPDREENLKEEDPEKDPEEGDSETEEDPEEEEDQEEERDASGEESSAVEIELHVDDILDFEDAENVAVSRSGNALRVEENRIRAVDVTEEPVLLSVDETVYRVTVTKARLSVFLIDGQSNAYGNSGSHDTAAIVPASGNGYLWKDGELTDLRAAVKAKEKESPDASVGFWPALAAEWYALTGEKPVIINVAHNGRPIQEWPGYAASAVQTLNACLDSIDENKYTIVNGGYFWLHGESNSNPDTSNSQMVYATAPEYAEVFESVHNSYISAFSSRGISAFGGILAVRSWNNYAGKNERSEYCGPRAAQQYLANRYGDLFMASVLSDSWRFSDSSSFTYKAKSGKYSAGTGTISSLFADLHYAQTAYNMLGLDAADGIWSGWLSGSGAADFTLYGYDGVTAIEEGAVIFIENHRLITGEANAREKKAAQLTVVPTPRNGSCGGVTMELMHKDGSRAEGLMTGCGYFPDISAIHEDLLLKVTMGSAAKTYTVRREKYKLKKGTITGNGTLSYLDENGRSISTASPGDTVILKGKPGEGSIQTAMTVTNVKTGQPVAATYEGNEDGSNIYSLVMPASDIRSEAGFLKPGTDNIGFSYRIVFDKNAAAATGTMKAMSGKITATAAITANAFGQKGYRFTGWNTEPDGTGVPVADKEKLINVFFYNDQSLKLYAQWAKDSYEAVSSGGVITLHWRANETVSIDGVSYMSDADGNIRITTGNPKILTCYSYNRTAGDEHERYPTGMKVYVFTKKNGTEYAVEYMERLNDILRYAGSSIRISGNKGIRMITGVPENIKRELAGDGIDGYTLLEYGTVVQWKDKLNGKDLTLETPSAKSNYAYKRGEADPVFATVNGVQQYTNVLVGFSLDQCAQDLALRAYMKLKAPDGSTVVIYGGTLHRSIGYIAWQNRNAFSPGTAAYRYIWEIVHHVYGTKYDSDYKQ